MRVVTMEEYNKLLLKAIRHDPKKYEMKDGVPVKKSLSDTALFVCYHSFLHLILNVSYLYWTLSSQFSPCREIMV